jgi:hypothetical protein
VADFKSSDQSPTIIGASAPKGLLYHYTGQKGLLGILNSKSIWATHVRYLNDESEFVTAWEKSWNALQEKIRQKEFPDKDPNFKQSLEKVFRNSRGRIETNDSQKGAYYVFCLTDDSASDSHKLGFDGDRLSQWRAYSKGTIGFSLGFDAGALRSSFSAPEKMLHLFNRCEYSEQEQDAQINSLVDRHLGKFLAAWDSYFSESQKSQLTTSETRKEGAVRLWELLMEMYLDFIEFGMFVKHRGFREEDEWRAAFVPESPKQCSFYESAFGLTPYLTVGLGLDASPCPLKRIVVGPGSHKAEWVHTINLMLAKIGVSGVEVVPSQIPYRNW